VTYNGNTTPPTVADTYTVIATITGPNYSGSDTVTLVIAKADQAITFNPLSDKNYGDPDFVVSATSDSGLTVAFAASGACTVTGDTVHLTTAGTCEITASQSGDVNHNAAPNVAQSFTVHDVVAPVITMLGSSPLNIRIGSVYSDAGATASDDVDGDVSGNIAVTVTPGVVSTAVAGTYIVHYNVEDAAGNDANEIIRTVNVVGTIAASAGPNGSIDPLGEVEVAPNGSQTFNFTPDSGYQVGAVFVDGVRQLPVPASSYTFASVTADHTIEVVFVGIVDPTTLTGGGGGGGSPTIGNVVAFGGGRVSLGGGQVLGASTSTESGTDNGGQVLGDTTIIYQFTVNLRFGSRGNDVVELQKALKKLGFFPATQEPTGYFGPLTRTAVIAYQKANGITPAVGFVGPLTRASLNSNPALAQ
jgi:hypothetical protein